MPMLRTAGKLAECRAAHTRPAVKADTLSQPTWIAALRGGCDVAARPRENKNGTFGAVFVGLTRPLCAGTPGTSRALFPRSPCLRVARMTIMPKTERAPRRQERARWRAICAE